MATPRAVKAAMILSVATTGGAMYYFLSEGGDPEKLDDNITNATEKLTQIGAKVSETSAKLAETTSTFKETVSSWTVPKEQTEQHLTTERNPTDLHADTMHNAQKGADNSSTSMEMRFRNNQLSDSKCHTCSGPRIWFFAEKLRLKRRITPYPDPPQQ